MCRILKDLRILLMFCFSRLAIFPGGDFYFHDPLYTNSIKHINAITPLVVIRLCFAAVKSILLLILIKPFREPFKYLWDKIKCNVLCWRNESVWPLWVHDTCWEIGAGVFQGQQALLKNGLTFFNMIPEWMSYLYFTLTFICVIEKHITNNK